MLSTNFEHMPRSSHCKVWMGHPPDGMAATPRLEELYAPSEPEHAWVLQDINVSTFLSIQQYGSLEDNSMVHMVQCSAKCLLNRMLWWHNCSVSKHKLTRCMQDLQDCSASSGSADNVAQAACTATVSLPCLAHPCTLCKAARANFLFHLKLVESSSMTGH